MLADGVEASVRSLASRDEPAIRAMVARIIDERLEDGQFDECDLTLRDLERSARRSWPSCWACTTGAIAYPQNKIVELESRRAASAGGSAEAVGPGPGASIGPAPDRAGRDGPGVDAG